MCHHYSSLQLHLNQFESDALFEHRIQDDALENPLLWWNAYQNKFPTTWMANH
ncbi:hypothetical protein PILCRDRAFT_17353 [Piloderma croceum F 1598]|uniref:Uncharacterized protein n=1 Tax=Piloderma croceum (strain F 1598) TaxID=765440 RepID=A0A0C3ETM1_PILCF|nr:hypothetical protein PILCRDRAFT_17353 [Piloderma croceum F 1598]